MLKTNDHTFSKTRLAPTPSGFLHVGNILSFAITAAMARQTGAKILLRIDDVDRERTNKLFVQDIFDTLHFLEIPWDEGPKDMKEFDREYSQMHRMPLYREALQELQDQVSVFACTCTRASSLATNADGVYRGTCINKKIPFDAPGTCLRLLTSDEKELKVKIWDGSVVHTTLPARMHNFIVRRKDRFPAYQLTSLIDDLHFGIDLIVRGDDLWPSTLSQLYLSLVLGRDTFKNTAFCHHALLTDEAGSKLSKSAGSTSVQHLRKEGKKPAYIYTQIAAMCGAGDIVNSYEALVTAIGTNLMANHNKVEK